MRKIRKQVSRPSDWPPGRGAPGRGPGTNRKVRKTVKKQCIPKGFLQQKGDKTQSLCEKCEKRASRPSDWSPGRRAPGRGLRRMRKRRKMRKSNELQRASSKTKGETNQTLCEKIRKNVSGPSDSPPGRREPGRGPRKL